LPTLFDKLSVMVPRPSPPAVSRRALDLEGAAGRLAADLVEPEDPRGFVMLLHGGGQTRHSWHGTAAALAGQRWTTLTYDARGHGDSDWAPSGDYSIDAYVADLRLVIGQVAPRRPLVLVGASLGGMTILIGQAGTPVPADTRGQAGTPGLADGIVLVDIVPKPQPGGVERIQRFMTANPDGFASLDEAAAAIDAYNPRRGRPRDQSGLRKNLRHGDDGRWRWHWDPRILGDGSDLQALVTGTRATDAAARLSGQTLLVSGGDSDVVRREDVLRFQKLVPNAETVNVAGAGHMVAGDRNDRFADAIARFLDRIQE
jgi:pimeloyl-ACP methyl ester carboxylesterase